MTSRKLLISAASVAALVSLALRAYAMRVSLPPASTLVSAVRASVFGMPWWDEREIASIASMNLTHLPAPPRDPSNHVTADPRAAALGARVFADSRLSANGKVSCASCHQASRGFQDGLPRAVGLGVATRRTMSVVGAAYVPWLFWDGRADSPWAQALGPLENGKEHGGTRALYVAVLAAFYRREYEQIFGSLPSLEGMARDAGPLGSASERAAWFGRPVSQRDSITRAFVNLGKTLAAYERTLAYSVTRVDRYAAALESGRRPRAGDILSPDEAQGLRLFVGKANCVTCHMGARLTDDSFHNTGVAAVPGLPVDVGRISGVESAGDDPFNCVGAFSDAPRDSLGHVRTAACGELRFAARGSGALVRAYRTPSLRGAASRAPFMHAGQILRLRDVLAHYNVAPRAPLGRSELRPLGLTPREINQLEAFLRALDSTPSERAPR